MTDDAEVAAEMIDVNAGRFTRRERYLGILGGLICFFGFWIAGRIFAIPADRHFSASLQQQPTLVSTWLVVILIYGICVAIASLVAGVIGFDAGILCAGAGLCALSIRGGAMRYTLLEDPTAGVWIKLAIESILLAGLIAGGTVIEHVLCHLHLLHHDDHRHVVNEIHESTDQRALAVLANVIVTSLLLMLFAASDRKAQVLTAVAISCFLGTLAAYYLVPTKPSAWYWSAPIVVGIIGYLCQYFASPAGWQIGEVRGAFAALARPLPLDYAGCGVGASVIGYWISRRWQHQREVMTVTSPANA